MTLNASGPFDVKLNPLQGDDADWGGFSRMSLDKRFHGDLDATSRGQMTTIRTDVAGSAGYVALERVTGTLKGRKGTFVLQHSGIMNRGEGRLTVTVVPDSATDELKDLSGEMKIIINEDGKHFYDFTFAFPG